MILGVGHPCTGTGYVAKTLQKSGLQVGHERWLKDGMVSWGLAAPITQGRMAMCNGRHAENIPWDKAKVIYSVRNPVDSVNSVVAEDTTRFARYRTRYLNGLTDDPLYNAMLSLIQWHRLCLDRGPGILYRVESRHDDERLGNFLGVEIKPYNKKYNSKGRSKIYKYTVDDMSKQSCWPEFVGLCKVLGYSV
jgi:hypothetical protein